MTEKTRREMLSETLQNNAREVSSWPTWMKGAVSTARIFEVTPAAAAEAVAAATRTERQRAPRR